MERDISYKVILSGPSTYLPSVKECASISSRVYFLPTARRFAALEGQKHPTLSDLAKARSGKQGLQQTYGFLPPTHLDSPGPQFCSLPFLPYILQ